MGAKIHGRLAFECFHVDGVAPLAQPLGGRKSRGKIDEAAALPQAVGALAGIVHLDLAAHDFPGRPRRAQGLGHETRVLGILRGTPDHLAVA